jgi:choline dehydrogenase-like flavoprotein
VTRPDDLLGNRSLARFDFCVIGSGAGGGSVAHVLTAAGKNVLVLEAGGNPFPGLDDPRSLPPPLHSNDELKYAVRRYLYPDPLLEPRTFRADPARPAQLNDDVNVLPKAVGGAFQLADAKIPRFNAVDFRLRSAMEAVLTATPGLTVPGFGADAASANFADWPFGYEDIEPFYVEAEGLFGAQGLDGDNVFESHRSRPYPMPPGVGMYVSRLLADAARDVTLPGVGTLRPHTYPAAINSRFRDDRPPCIDCGHCCGYGCTTHAKGSPAVTTLRRALLTGRCQLRYNAAVVRLVQDAGHVREVEYIDGAGARCRASADAFVLAASAIESARLCLLSDALGNSSGQVGQNLMFHLRTTVNGFVPQRLHGQRGRAVTHGLSDFRGVLPGGEAIRVLQHERHPAVAMGGICEFGASEGKPIADDAMVLTRELPEGFGVRSGLALKNALRDQAIGQHLLAVVMHAEDAPQRTNAVDLDPRYRDVHGSPVARITYRSHPYELSARRFYRPYLEEIVRAAGVPPEKVFVAPLMPPPRTHHVLGTLRMGSDPATSVVDPRGRFWDVDNLYAADGSVFPTSSGYNPTLTIIAVALRIAHAMAGTSPGG